MMRDHVREQGNHKGPVQAWRFGEFELHRNGELRRNGLRVSLGPQAAQVLLLLISRAGEALSREEIIQSIWGEDGTFIEFDQGLNSSIRRIRRALRDDARSPRYVETLHRHGYRFLPPVEGIGLPTKVQGPRRMVPLLAAAAIGALALTAFLALRGADTPAPAREIVVAVAPFEEAVGPDEEPYRGTALSQELIVQLGSLRTPGLLLVGWSSSSQLPPGGADPGRVGRESGADLVLSGGIGRQNGHVRVVARLVRVSDLTQVWAESYEGDSDDLMRLQADVAGRIASAVSAQLFPSQNSPHRSTAVAAEAYESYLKARYLLEKKGPGAMAKSALLFREAVERDAGFAEAHAGLSSAHAQLAFRNPSSRQDWTAAREAALRALELDADLAEAHITLGFVLLYSDWDFSAARSPFINALKAAPGLGRVHSAYAAYLAAVGEHDEAVTRARLARRLDPAGLSVRSDLCWYLNYARRFDEAVVECRAALELEPQDQYSLLGLAEANRQAGDFWEASNAVASAFRLSLPESLTKETADAESLDALWKQIDTRVQALAQPPALFAALTSSLAGHRERAFTWLEAAVLSRPLLLVYLDADPRFDSLRGDPRFDDLLRRIGLGPSVT